MKRPLPISRELESKLEKADPDIQQFIDALCSEIAKLQKRLFAVEANNVSLHAQIGVLKEELRLRDEQIREFQDKIKSFDEFRGLPLEERYKKFQEIIEEIKKRG